MVSGNTPLGGMAATKRGVCPVDGDLQKSVIKMPFLIRGNSGQKQRCQLPICHQTEPGARPGLVISAQSLCRLYLENNVAPALSQDSPRRGSGGHMPAPMPWGVGGRLPALPSVALCLLLLAAVRLA